MQGAALGNFFAIASRGFVAAYGLVIAYVIENGTINIIMYGGIMSMALFAGAIVSYVFSTLTIIDYEKIKSYKEFNNGYRRESIELSEANSSKIKINKFMSLFVGVQFISVVMAYSLCIKYVEYRLIIISFVPIVSMIGTIISVVFIEPNLAKAVDNDVKMASAVSQEYMRARAASFMFSFVVLLVISLMSE